MSQDIPYKKGGTQNFSLLRWKSHKWMLPKASILEANKGLYFQKVDKGNSIVHAGVIIDAKKYFPLDSLGKSDDFILINLTDSILMFPNNAMLLSVKEVKSGSDNWIPIEFQYDGFCKHGERPLELLPGQMTLLTGRKTYGEIAGKLRVRLVICKNGNWDYLLSDEYLGTYQASDFFIDPSQQEELSSSSYKNLYLLNPIKTYQCSWKVKK
jgi:hypothetical protein